MHVSGVATAPLRTQQLLLLLVQMTNWRLARNLCMAAAIWCAAAMLPFVCICGALPGVRLQEPACCKHWIKLQAWAMQQCMQ
jgi:hypothetical protein